MADLPNIGDAASVEITLTEDDIAAFARLSGDDNPIHLDDEAARLAGFDGRIVHGALVLGVISRLLGTRLPGPGTIYLGQEIRFLRPIYPGRRIVAHVQVSVLRPDKPLVSLRTWAEVDGETAIDGMATVLVRR